MSSEGDANASGDTRPQSYDQPIVTHRGMRTTTALLIGLVPGCVSLSWLPLRAHLPNTDLALVLVVAVAGVGFVSGRLGTTVGAVSAGISFDILHTRPYGHLAISHGRDILTTAFLVLAGFLMGEVANRLARYRQVAVSEADAFALVSDAAGLVATGSESRLVIEALAQELTLGLDLSECRYETGRPSGEVPSIARDGSLVGGGPVGDPSPSNLDLPIWTSGEVVAHFRLVLRKDEIPSLAQRRLAVSVSDQAGAALSAATHAPTTPPSRRRLRLVRG